MRQRAWGLLVLVPAAVFAVVVLTAPFTAFHLDLYLAGTPRRFAATVVKAGRSDARAALWLDNVFVLTWLLTVPRLLRAGLVRWAPERRRSFGVWRATPLLATLAATLDLVENGLSLAMVGKLRPASGMVLAVTTIAWTKWLLYVVAGAGLMALVVGPLLGPVVRPIMRRLFAPLDGMAGTHPPDTSVRGDETLVEPRDDDGADADEEHEPRLGICVSGGGIRAASVAVGALRRLDAPRPAGRSIFARSSWLVAVSGGSYAAGGWRITRSPDRAPTLSDQRDGLFDAAEPWASTVRRRRRFLDNGSLSIVGGVLNVVVRTVFVLGGLLSVVHLASAFVGRAVRSRAIHRDFPFVDATGGIKLDLRDLVPLRLVLPGAVLLLIAVYLALMAYTRSSEQRSRLTTPAIGFALAGGGLLLALVGVPIGIVHGRRVLAAVPVVSRADGGAGLLGTLSTLGVFGAVSGVLFARLKRKWLRLGGVLLAIVLVLYAGKIADAHAYGYTSGWVSWPLPGTDARLPLWVLAIAWLIALECTAAHRLTLGGVYRKRLAATFALIDGPVAPLAPMPYSAEPRWSAYAPTGTGPELIIAATAHTSADTFCGLPAYGFTFRQNRVTLHDRTDGTSASVAVAAYPTGSWWDGYPRGWIVSRSMALSGAAFASAMGRQALGTTNALLVALNLRLGAWVPNPRFAHWFADPATAPRVHLGYLAKELLGRYQPGRDAFVYVADGGHRENLGLVELLRERPDVVCCIDASGDRPGTFQTLHEAIELALIELGVDIDIDLTRLRRDTALPLDCAVEGVATYPPSMGGGIARVLYGRYQLSEASSPALLQYGALDGRFPGYSTADQFLSEVEYDQLVALGEHVGDRIVKLFDGGNP